MDRLPRSPISSGLDRRHFLIGAGAVGGALAVFGAAGCSSGGSGGSDGSATSTSDVRTTAPPVDPMVDAVLAGVPLVVTMRTMQTFAGLVGVNRLFPTKTLADVDSRYVVAPNHDTLYVIAVLDLDAGPQVLTLPEIPDRYHVIQILDAWMGQIALLGTRATLGDGGRWVVARQGEDPELEPGQELVESPTRHAFILGRVRATEADVDAAAAVAASIRMEPLDPTPPPDGERPTMLEPFGPPNEVGENGAAFFDELGTLLLEDEPPAGPQRAALEEVDDVVGPGLYPTQDHPDRVPELDELVADVMAGLADSQQSLDERSARTNGWAVNLELGEASEQDLRQQAFIARYFWGPVPAEEAVYARAAQASDGQPLDGSKDYRLMLDGDRLPPVDGFWSLTVYGEDLYFVPNEIDRYSLSGDSPDLVRTEDGSIRVELSPDRPADETVNWLPTPDGPFTLLLRLYLPQQAILDGDWEYPEIGIST